MQIENIIFFKIIDRKSKAIKNIIFKNKCDAQKN